MYGIIYLLTNTRTNMQYVGQTILGLVPRWNGHVAEANAGKTTQIANAIRLYGAPAFTRQILKTGVRVSDLNKAERDEINRYGTLYPFGYNERLPWPHIITDSKIFRTVLILILGGYFYGNK